MHKKDNYNEIYQELINQGFLDNIGNGVIKGVKGVGSGISKLWKWNKKRKINNQINENIKELIDNVFETYKSILKTLDEQVHIKVDEIHKNYKSIDDLNTCIDIINNAFNNANTLLKTSIDNLNQQLPKDSIQRFLLDIQNIGFSVSNIIISKKLQYNTENEEMISNIIKQQYTAIEVKLKNTYLKSLLPVSENKYLKVYMQILLEEGFSFVNPPAESNISVTASTDKSQQINKKPVKSSIKPQQTNEKIQIKPIEDATNDKLFKISNNLFDICSIIHLLYSCILYRFSSAVKEQYENSNGIFQKISKAAKKDKSKNSTGFTILVDNMFQLSSIYFALGVLNGYKPLSKFTLK